MKTRLSLAFALGVALVFGPSTNVDFTQEKQVQKVLSGKVGDLLPRVLSKGEFDVRVQFIRDYNIVPEIARLTSAQASDALCLALNIYNEASGEPDIGKWAVAAVTLNRHQKQPTPGSICDIVYQQTQVRMEIQGGFVWVPRAQFSWVSIPKVAAKKPAEIETWQGIQRIALQAINDIESLAWVNTNCEFDHFHGFRVHPDWDNKKDVVCKERIGNHVFVQLYDKIKDELTVAMK